jgi:hypothetical protein
MAMPGRILTRPIQEMRQSKYIADLMSGRNAGAFASVEDPRIWVMLREDTARTIFYGTTRD